MTVAIITPITKTPSAEVFENKIVDNDGFFDAMEEGFSKTLSEPEIYGQTRLALHELLAQMKTQTFIHGVTEWTANEQKVFFEQVQTEIKKTHREIKNAGILALTNMREKIQTLIKDEIWREINDAGRKYNLQDGNGNVMIANIRDYQQFLEKSFLTDNETRIIPLDLRLTIGQTETVKDAREKLKKYGGKYNALILVDEGNHPIGIIKADVLEKYKKTENLTLEKVEYISNKEIYGYYTTSTQDAKNIMQKYDINILPIIDTNTETLIGILTSSSLVRKGVQYYSTVSLTKLNIEVGMKGISEK
ncbi:MAG: CBS domain-containing protein [Candidatus Gracilibacteria bacterium]